MFPKAGYTSFSIYFLLILIVVSHCFDYTISHLGLYFLFLFLFVFLFLCTLGTHITRVSGSFRDDFSIGDKKDSYSLIARDRADTRAVPKFMHGIGLRPVCHLPRSL